MGSPNDPQYRDECASESRVVPQQQSGKGTRSPLQLQRYRCFETEMTINSEYSVKGRHQKLIRYAHEEEQSIASSVVMLGSMDQGVVMLNNSGGFRHEGRKLTTKHNALVIVDPHSTMSKQVVEYDTGISDDEHISLTIKTSSCFKPKLSSYTMEDFCFVP